jgi:hypothetical protein
LKLEQDQFFRYERLRQAGIVNMFDAGTGNILTGLPITKFVEVAMHYSELEEKYHLRNQKLSEIEPIPQEWLMQAFLHGLQPTDASIARDYIEKYYENGTDENEGKD